MFVTGVVYREEHLIMNKPTLFGAAFCLWLLVGGGAWMLWPTPDPEEPPAVEDSDTGMTRTQTEDLMRTIGYIQ